MLGFIQEIRDQRHLVERVESLENEVRHIKGQEIVPVHRDDGEVGYVPRDVAIIGDLLKKKVPGTTDEGMKAYIIHAGRLAYKNSTSEWVNTSDIKVLDTPVERVIDFVSPFTSDQRIGIMKFLLQDREGKTATQLKNEMGLDSGPLYHHLRDLVSAKYVRKRERGRYELSVKGHVALLTVSHMAAVLDKFEKDEEKARREDDTQRSSGANQSGTPLTDQQGDDESGEGR